MDGDAQESQTAHAAVHEANNEWSIDQCLEENNINMNNEDIPPEVVFPSPASLTEAASLADADPGADADPDAMTGQLYQSEISNSIYQSHDSLPPDLHSSINVADHMFMDSASDTTAWPWLHENLFLQTDWSAVWPDGGPVDLAFPEQNGIDEAMNDDSARGLLMLRNNAQGPEDPNISALADFSTSSAAGGWQPQLPEQNHVTLHQHEGFNRIRKWHLKASSSSVSTQKSQAIAHARQIDETHSSLTTRQSRLIELLVNDAAQATHQATKADRAAYWSSMSTKVQDVFSLSRQYLNSSSHILQHFVDLYLQHFGPLWPLLSHQGLDCDFIHPLLYLTLTSIGAMYGGTQMAHFGTMMHNRVRQTLTTALELGDADDDLIWLGQARLLTQVAALYFGQSRAFSYAQHLGGVLVAQARRMNLFSAPRTRYDENRAAHLKQPEERLDRWLHVEARRRLAFGILRAETYTSVLLNTRPLISSEEIDLELPCSDPTWRGPSLPPDIFLALVERDQAPGRARRFSDMIRIAFERDETSSVLDPNGHELLLFGLQQAVWRFSNDHHLFQRLTGSDEAPSNLRNNGLEGDMVLSEHPPRREPTQQPKDFATNLWLDIMDDHLVSKPRRMCDLKGDLDRLTNALRKWKESFRFISAVSHLGHNRNSLLSSLLLYHLSYLRLQAPVEDMHYVSYRIVDKRSVERNIIDEVSSWANSRRGYIALRHACTIWSLISHEVQRTEETRAKFNFLAFMGLHHAAVVLWTYAGAHDPKNVELGGSMLTIAPLNDFEPPIPLKRSTTSAILRLFSRVFDVIAPGRWSSFGAAALKLSECSFPLPQT